MEDINSKKKKLKKKWQKHMTKELKLKMNTVYTKIKALKY